MTKMLALTSIAVTCMLFQSIQAATFECNDEPSVCKTKFGTQFEKEFKEIHLAGSRKLFTTYIDKATALKSELSPDDPYSKGIETSIDVVRKSLQKLNDNVNDNKKIAEAVEEAMNGMTWDLHDEPTLEHFKNVFKSQNMRASLADVMRELGRNIGNLWAEMYAGLREKDLKMYSEYKEVNALMEALRGNGARPAKGSDYTQAAEILSETFKLPYFEAITDIS